MRFGELDIAMGSLMHHRVRSFSTLFITIILTVMVFSNAFSQEVDDSEMIELGAQIFAENCAACHGEDGEGRVGATLAKDWPSIRPDLRIRETAEKGVTGTLMPAWGQAYGGPLNDQELDAVTMFILSWESGQPRFELFTPTIDTSIALTPPPGIDGDPNRGANLFAVNCALCHGSNGEGRIGANLSKDWPAIRPDLRVKSVIESGVPGSVMPAWSQANGGPLSDKDINDITAYILTWSGTNTESATQETVAGPLRGWPVWIIFIGVFILVIIAVVYYSRQQSQQD